MQNVHKIGCCLFPSHFFDETSAICFPYCTKFGYPHLAIQLMQLHDSPFIPKPSAFHISGCSLHKEISISLLCFFILFIIVWNILTLRFLGYRSFFPSLTRLLLTFNKADSGNRALIWCRVFLNQSIKRCAAWFICKKSCVGDHLFVFLGLLYLSSLWLDVQILCIQVSLARSRN